jgi:N-hydroxyarylamine O-acetyltransferase
MLLMRAYIPGGQVKIANRTVTIMRGEDTHTYELPDRAALRALVAEHFGFDMPEIERMRVGQVPDWT